GEVGAEGVRRRLRGSVEGLLERQRFAEQRRDAVEAALDSRLPHARLEALGVPQRERGERREGLEQLLVVGAEAPLAVAQRHAQQPERLAGRGHGSEERIRKLLVRRMRNRVSVALSPRELETDQALVEAVDRGAAQHAALAIEQVAVGGVGVKQRRQFLDEPAQQRVELELAR